MTDQITKLFETKKDISAMVKDLRKNDPIPLDEIQIDQEMLDLYVRKFNNK